MKQVPFYANRDDNFSCMLACMRSILEYISGKKYSWDDMEELTGYHGKPVWTVKMWSDLAKQGYDIKMIEKFDYGRFASEGRAYLEAYLKPEELNWQLENTEVLNMGSNLPAFLQLVPRETRNPQLIDIDRLLAGGYIVMVQLNSRALNGKEGYVSHVILVHDKAGDDYIAHDPGLPPVPNRIVESAALLEAMGGNDNRVEVTGIKKATDGKSRI